jgi:hypothetical protein
LNKSNTLREAASDLASSHRPLKMKHNVPKLLAAAGLVAAASAKIEVHVAYSDKSVSPFACDVPLKAEI